MSELKPGWRRVRFGDVVRQVKDRVDPATSGLERYVAGEHMDTDDLRIRRWGTIGDSDLGPAFHMRFRPGQVLYGSRRTYLRKVAQADFDGVCANTTFVLEAADPQVLLPKLLPFVMQTKAFHEHSVRESKGSVNPYVNFSDLAWYEFSLPPLEEQQRIASLLRSAQRAVDQCAAAASSGLELRRSMEKYFFIEHPQGAIRRIGDVAAVRNGTTPSRKKPEYWGGTTPWLTTSKVHERRIASADEHVTNKALAECSLGGLVRPGSSLVAMIGEGVTRGKVAFLDIPSCISQNFAAISPRSDVDDEYLFYFLESHYEALRHWSQGTNQQALNCGLIRNFPIRIPSIARQRQIAGCIAHADQAVGIIEGRLESSRKVLATTLAVALGA